MAERKNLPLIPITETVIFPGVESRIFMAETIGKIIEEIIKNGQKTFVGFATKTFKNPFDYQPEDFYQTGTLMTVSESEKSEKGYILSIETLERVSASGIFRNSPSGYVADIVSSPVFPNLEENEEREMVEYAKHMLRDLGRNYKAADAFLRLLDEMHSLDMMIGYIVPMMGIPVEEKQALLELNTTREQGLYFLDLVVKERDSIHLRIEISKKFARSKEEKYRENLLREQLYNIQKELGELGAEDYVAGPYEEDEEYRHRIEASDMPEEVLAVARKELRKLQATPPGSQEVSIIMNYLDVLLDLPWHSEVQNIDIDHARKVLDSHHYGIEDVKKRIIEHLAVMKLKEDKQGSILLLVGPPGTGKTSLGKSIAEALNREYVRASLGGIRDESEIRGHRKTYIGAMPGRIIKGITQAGTMNPVFVLDEIDKLSVGYQGDPAAALLEVLDPEQNSTFADHYCEVPYDLSDVFFIATANDASKIPGPLKDRAEIIELSSYTNREKYHIAVDHLMPAVLEEHGLTTEQLIINDEAMTQIIEDYTAESGVRGLKRQLSKLARVTAEKIVSGKEEIISVTEDRLHEFLGKKIRHHDRVGEKNAPGVVTGMAWTAVGGEILFTEATFMPGKGNVILTGQLGDVMKESTNIAMSLIRSRLGDKKFGFNFFDYDTHIHVPEGATPKDGPSAGVTMTTAIASLVTGIPVDSRLSMTGEVTLTGQVLPVGGIREKVIAAHRSGIKRIILPKDNQEDLEDVPEEVRDDLEFIFVETIEEVLYETIGIRLPEYDIHFNLTFNRPKSEQDDFASIIL